MRIFNENKTQEVQEYDESMYHLQPDKLLVAHHEATPEIQKQSHYVVVAEYDNGGKDVEEVVDVPYQPAKNAYDEYEDILILVPFTQDELDEQRVIKLKQNLANTDYIANKLAEAIADSLVTGDNAKVYELKTKYAKELQDRKSWRDEIDRLEKN